MKILVTGTPATGKTSVAKALAKKLKWKVINEREFCIRKKIGTIEGKDREIAVPLKELERKLKAEIKGKKNLILEGHLLCELKLPIDFIVLLRVSPKVLEKRLREKGYNELKVLDNVFCEKINYCKEQLLQNFPEKSVLEARNGKGIKEITQKILKEIKKLRKGKH